MRRWIMAIVYCWAGLAIASGQQQQGMTQQPASQQQHAQHQQRPPSALQVPNVDPRGSEKTPLVAQEHKAKEGDQETQLSNRNKEWHASTDSQMALPWNTLLALALSVLALFIAIMNFRRKSGILIRGSFGVASSSDCDDRFIDRVTLTNMKDRSVTIFAIYLKVGHNCYIRIENFAEVPLTLRAYETFSKEFGPIQFYSLNLSKVDVNHLLDDKDVKKSIVLSTPEGKYIVPSSIRVWDPIRDFFRNHSTAVMYPRLLTYKGKNIGSNIIYIVDFTYADGTSSHVEVRPGDYRVRTFKAFALTKESLVTAQTLRDYINARISEGLVKCQSFEVYDIEEWKRSNSHMYPQGDRIKIQRINFAQYHFGGRFVTWKASRDFKKENKRLLQQHGQAMEIEAKSPPPTAQVAVESSTNTQ